MTIEFLDILILLIPLVILNIYLSTRNSLNSKLLEYRFPFILISYTILILTPTLILLLLYEIYFYHTLVFHLQDFRPNIMNVITGFNLNFILNFLLAWLISVLYISLVFSQIALRLLNTIVHKNTLQKNEITSHLPDSTKTLLTKHNIQVYLLTTTEFGLIFSSSYISLRGRRNFIYINESIIKTFTAEEINAAIIHEIGHIHNMDTTFFPIINSVSKILFFLPNLRSLKDNYQEVLEQKADNYAVQYLQDPKTLASSIMKTLTFMKEPQTILQQTQQNSAQNKVSISPELSLLLKRVKKLNLMNK